MYSGHQTHLENVIKSQNDGSDDGDDNDDDDDDDDDDVMI